MLICNSIRCENSKCILLKHDSINYINKLKNNSSLNLHKLSKKYFRLSNFHKNTYFNIINIIHYYIIYIANRLVKNKKGDEL